MSEANKRNKLTDLLKGDNADAVRAQWNETEATPDYQPIPRGQYTASAIDGELTTARTGTLGYKITFQVAEGLHQGRMLWHDLWLTPAAMSMTKRELAKLGITELKQLDEPFPSGIVCEVDVVVNTTDEGTSFNKIRKLKRIDPGPSSTPAGRPGLDPDFGPADVAPRNADADKNSEDSSLVVEQQADLIEEVRPIKPSAMEAGR